MEIDWVVSLWERKRGKRPGEVRSKTAVLGGGENRPGTTGSCGGRTGGRRWLVCCTVVRTVRSTVLL